MGTPNRHNSAEEAEGGVTVQLSDKVAIIAGLKKVGCDELSPKEWVELINLALARAKPYFKYLSFFLPTIERTLTRFHLSGGFVGERWHWSIGAFQTDSRDIGAFLSGVHKVVQICEVSDPSDKRKSKKFLLNLNGVFMFALCQRTGRQFDSMPRIYKLEMVNGDHLLESAIIQYPQIGPMVFFALAAMLKDTYAKRLQAIENMGIAGQELGTVCNKLVLAEHYVEKYPWGVSDGSK